MTQVTSRFCPECGAEHEPAARFCERCGHHFGEQGAPAEEQPTAQQAPPTAQMPTEGPATGDMPYVAPPRGTSTAKPTWPWVVGALGAVLVIAAIVVALVLLLGGGDEDDAPPTSSYAGRLAAVLDPVGAANTSMSDALANLEPGDAIDDVASTRRAAATETGAARTAIEALGAGGTATVSAADQTLTTDARQALRAERSLLTVMAAAIARPSERTANALAAPAQAARDAWARVDETIPGAGGELDEIDNLAAWARAKAGVTGNRPSNANGADCGGFEGVSGVFARNVDCQTALRVAVTAAQTGAGSDGFACRVTQPGAGTDRWACSKGDATITFSATNDTPDDDTGGVQEGGDVPQQPEEVPVEPGDMPGEGGDVAPEDLPEGDPGAIE